MSDDSILEGLRDAVAFAKGDKKRGKVHKVRVEEVDVRAVREKLHLSQDKFARKFGVSPSTLRNWEQGRRRPHGTARVLLQIIDREPEAVQRALT